MSNFPPDVIAAAQSSEKVTGCPACITLAQWALESDYGKCLSAQNNWFGIKWTAGCPYTYRSSVTHEELKNGEVITIHANFINFPTPDLCFDYHGRLIVSNSQHSPYKDAQPALKQGWKPFLIAMAKHYATDQHYADKLLGIIAANKLDQFNVGGPDQNDKPNQDTGQARQT